MKDLEAKSLRPFLFSCLERTHRLFVSGLAQLAAAYSVCLDEEGIPEENIDEKMDEAIRIATVLTPLLSARPLPKEAVDGFLLSLPLFSDVTREEIAFFFDLFASEDFHGSYLLPEKAEGDCLSLFLKREVELFRLIALFDDIQSGMLEYGLDAYRIEDDLEDGFDILSSLEGKDEKSLMEELKGFAKRDDMDEKDAKRLKKDLRDILPLVGKEIAKNGK